MKEYSVVQHSLPRIDAVEKVTGKAKFAADIRLPGALSAKVLRSPYPHARILHIETERARHLPGVKAVITAEDFHEPDQQTIMAYKKARYVGEAVAAVAAITPEDAEEALKLITVEYDPLPPVFDPLEALKPGAPLIHEQIRGEEKRDNIAYQDEVIIGDIDDGFREAEVIVEHRYTSPMVHHGYIEPHACAAHADFDGSVTIWTSTQAQFRIRAGVAEALGLSMNHVRVIPTHIGGGFGGKSVPWNEPICALLSLKAQRAVTLILTREEELIVGRPRPACVIDLKTGAKRDGTLVASFARMVFNSGILATAPAQIGLSIGAGYRIPHVKNQVISAFTNTRPVGAVRGLASPQTAFAFESQLDEIASILKIDPLEFRFKNAWEAGDRTLQGYVLPNIGLKEALKKAAEKVKWGKSVGKNRGYGIAIGQKGGGATYSSAGVKINEDGTVSAFTGGIDLSGSLTSVAQVVAEELGISMENVTLRTIDSDIATQAAGSYGSLFTTSTGNAAKLAAEEMKKRLFKLASDHLEANVEDLEFHDQHVRVKGSPDKVLSFAELYNIALQSKEGVLITHGSTLPVPGAPPFAVHIVEVEVDNETGQVELLNYVNAQDIGFTLNPLSVEGQLEGAVVQGVGYAMAEEIIVQEGKTLNPTLLDYKIPSSLDVPEIETVLVESQAGGGPYGAMGVGESPIIPPAGAIANAIFHAVGVRIRDLPLTPEKVLFALKGKTV
ncbi:MAG: xanthine dehydrogenase family protein molybdopterin-binding subunit [Candidatus Tectomicrobia bacterium]|nr:xanthine dehydrogenase family protein molybdopterin-binding subunit [Candidatus Tectomicrobia bacterium]